MNYPPKMGHRSNLRGAAQDRCGFGVQRYIVVKANLVPEAGIEPARLTARDFLTTSAFAAVLLAQDVRGLEHAFTLALRL